MKMDAVASIQLESDNVGRYASLENMDSITGLNIWTQDEMSCCNESHFGIRQANTPTHPKHELISKRNKPYRYSLTYSGEDVSKQRIPLNKRWSSQSCNPIYFFEPTANSTNYILKQHTVKKCRI